MSSILWSVVSTVIVGIFTQLPHTALQLDTPQKVDTTRNNLIRKSNIHPPVIIFKDDKGLSIPLHIDEVSVSVKVIATMALTTMEITFRNDQNRILEGELNFPLGEGQFITRFAMDVNGTLREGVVVEKAKGRVIFEETVRKNIDPGLLELTRGNSFKTRVYPIPAKGIKKILIAYQQELVGDSEGDSKYLLPLDFKDTLSKFSLTAEVYSTFKPIIISSPSTGNFETENDGSFALRINHSNYRAGQALELTIPKFTAKSTAYIETLDNQKYFTITATPPPFTSSKQLPKRICLLWDASGSGTNRDKERELILLDTYFKKIGNCSVQLVTFSNEIDKPEYFVISNGNWNSLKTKLSSIVYDGGTQYGTLNLKNYTCDEFLLFSDGISTFGKSELQTSTTPIISINSSQHAEHSYLQYITRQTGGNYIDLTTLDNQQAASRIQELTYSFLSAVYDVNSIEDVYPSISTPVNGTIMICGKLQADKSEIILNFGFGKTIKHTEKIRLDANSQSVKTTMLPRLWAQKKIAELDMRYKTNKNAITELGKQFSIVTRNTSLLVLDRIEDYVVHQIIPYEDSLKQLYNTRISDLNKKQTIEDTSHTTMVLNLFKQRKEWWNKTFEPIKKFKSKDSSGLIRRLTRNPSFEDEQSTVINSNGENEFPAPRIAEGAVSNSRILSVTETNQRLEVANGRGMYVNESGIAKIQEANPLSASITLKKWDANTPYIQELQKASAGDEYSVYLELKKEYGTNPGFFMDCADFFSERNNKTLALRILSNIAEMELENHQLLRVLAHRLEQLGYISLAIDVFRDVLEMREEEPQSYRDLSLALAENKQYQEAADTLYKVITKKWDARFPEVELIALNEWNNILTKAINKLNTTRYDKRFIFAMPVDVRVVLNWDADNCDMDLWVFDPSNEKCFYSHPNTEIGGHLSRDMTGGYGPEEFILKKALAGKYQVKVQYYGSQQQKIAGATTIQLELYTRYMTGREEKKTITLRLKNPKELIDVGEFTFE
ncbi:MAG: DUF2135 domain-containing protein [Bacteroidetes bacterium]|nr:DUF2135 domain-containing protein [Bacteroidota bacterium]